MIPDQRREVLVRHLRSEGVLSVHQITELLGVSHMTVRRDIAALERQGRAFSVPGGVRIASQLRKEPSFQDKSMVDKPQKLAMGARAAKMVGDDMTVYVDAGTTMQALVPHLAAHAGLTVVTNDFTVVDMLIDEQHLDVIHIGGLVEQQNRSSVGRLAAATLMQIVLDIAFLSASSWDLSRGVTTPTEAKVGVKQAALDATSFAVLVAGSSKYGTFGMYKVAPLSRFDMIITDWALSEAAADGIRASGVSLEVAASTVNAPPSREAPIRVER